MQQEVGMHIATWIFVDVNPVQFQFVGLQPLPNATAELEQALFKLLNLKVMVVQACQTPRNSYECVEVVSKSSSEGVCLL